MITVSAMASRLDKVDERIKLLDRERKQVQIEAYLVTVSSEIARNIGINWSFAGDLGEGFSTTAFGSTELPTAEADGDTEGGSSAVALASGLSSSFLSSDGDIRALLDVLVTSGDASVNAQPRISVIDGKEAVFANTTQVPFATSSIQNNNSLNQNTITSTRVDFIDVGTILRVLPRITQDGKVIMEISSEDSSFTIRDVLSNDRVTSVPEKTQNIAETTVLVNDGETIVIGGLRTSSLSDKSNKVPILGDIPVLGRLFRRTEKNHQQRELLIFITPTIIDGTTQAEAYRLAERDQQFADTLFDDKKGDVRRSVDNFFGRDLFVSVGHKGGVLADGKFVKLSELRHLIRSDESNGKTVVIRSHPRSPKGLVDEIIEMAMEADRKFVIDNTPTPFVPSTSVEN
jgi:type II secretory pathway component GspD/PulD (secretin)